MRKIIAQIIQDSIFVKEKVLETLVPEIEGAAGVLITALKCGNKILICGNGGSAADAQHFAAELMGHFERDRKPLPAISLTTDTSNLTAISNDYSYEDVFSRQVQGLGKEGDVLIAISTSGNSPNILKAIEVGLVNKLSIIGLSGKSDGKMSALPIKNIVIPSESTARIQESHIMILHIWAKLIEDHASN